MLFEPLVARRVPLLLCVVLVGCQADPGARSPGTSRRPDSGLFRDFQGSEDSKADAAGRRLDAVIVLGSELCFLASSATTPGRLCSGTTGRTTPSGSVLINVHLRVTHHKPGRDILSLEIARGQIPLASGRLSPSQLRDDGSNVDFAVALDTWSNAPLDLVVDTLGNGRVTVEYFEIFRASPYLALHPGSGVYDDADELTIETNVAGFFGVTSSTETGSEGLTFKLTGLLASGVARIEDTGLRRILRVPVGALLGPRQGPVGLTVSIGPRQARITVLKEPPPCAYLGAGPHKVLVTGFEPFPVDAWHDNISRAALGQMVPAHMPGVELMRLVLPVEFEQASALVRDAIARCAPEVVVSMGQGRDAVELETTAYNLRDTSEDWDGYPDNRGLVKTGALIEPLGPATLPTGLPVAEIVQALAPIDDTSTTSIEPGRYICNDVFYSEMAAVQGTNIRAGFVHLPYTVQVDDAAAAHFARVAETIVNATIGAVP